MTEGPAVAAERRDVSHVAPLTNAALLSAQVGQALTFVMLAAVLPQIAAYFGGGRAGELIAQQMAVFPFLGLTIGGFLSGPVIARGGLRRTAIAAALFYALSGAVPLITSTAAPMLAASFVLGLSASLLTSAISGVTGEVHSGDRLAKVVSYQVALAIFAGATLGFVAALAAQTWGWRAAFAGYVAAGLVILLLAIAGLPDARARQADATGGARAVLRRAWPVYLLAFLAFVVITLAPTYLPFYMEAKGIASAATRSALLTVSTGASFFGSLLFSQIQGRVSSRALRVAAIVLLVGAYILYASWDGSVAVMVMAMALAGFGGGMIIPALFAAALDRAPHAGAQSVGFLNVAIFGGSFLTPYLLSVPREALGMQGMLWAVGAAIAAVGFASLALAPKSQS